MYRGASRSSSQRDAKARFHSGPVTVLPERAALGGGGEGMEQVAERCSAAAESPTPTSFYALQLSTLVLRLPTSLF